MLETGKTRSKEVAAISADYYQRIGRYLPFEKTVLPDIKNTRKLSEMEQNRKEGELILKEIQAGDHLILLDDKGKTFSSEKFAGHLQKLMNQGIKRLVFVIGGPYGFSPEVYARANEKLSLSSMTFSHQLVRCIFGEQLYRAFTILNNEPYHHA